MLSSNSSTAMKLTQITVNIKFLFSTADLLNEHSRYLTLLITRIVLFDAFLKKTDVFFRKSFAKLVFFYVGLGYDEHIYGKISKYETFDFLLCGFHNNRNPSLKSPCLFLY